MTLPKLENKDQLEHGVDSGRLGFSDKEAMALPLKGRDPFRKVRSMPFHPMGALKLTWERQTH